MTPDSAPLVIALVGHSNVGKTSLVSALTRDASLEVREEAGTTRATYRKVFRLDELPVLAFIDTPGFEQAGRMNKWLDGRATGEGARLDGRALLDTLLADTGSDARFAAEKEALRGALQADVLAYVADVSQPPTGQQRQELRLLRRAGVPLIAVLNVLDEADERAEWTETLRREGIDTIVPLDAHAFPAEQEAHFYRALSVLRPEQSENLQSITGLRARIARRHQAAAARLIAELLVDCLSYRLEVDCGSEQAAKSRRGEVNDRFKQALRERENAGLQALLDTLGFVGIDIASPTLGVESWSGEWQGDLFDPDQLRRYGVSAATLGAVGAIAGSFVDMLGGMGVGTLIGGVAGAAAGVAVGRRVSTRVRAGTVSVGPVDSVQFPSVLLNRSVEFWGRLAGRSHARRDAVSVGDGRDRLTPTGVAQLNSLARKCRRRPEWSGIDATPNDPERARVVDKLVDVVDRLLADTRE